METDIQTTTPAGSPIMAYGEARGPRMNGRTVGFALLVLVFLIVVGVGAATLFWPVDLPKNTFILASFHGGEHLSDPLPRVWQNTAETSKLPFVAGIAKTADGWQAFTVTLRGFGDAGSWTHATGPFVIHADTTLDLEKGFRAYMIERPIYALKSHAAFVTIKGDALDASLTGSLNGVIDGNVWKTTTRLTDHALHDLVSGDLAVDLRALPDAWPSLKDALHDQGFELDTMPETVAWSQTSGTLPALTLDFGADHPSTSTILALAAAAGDYDEVKIQFPDGTVAQDLRLPLHILASTSSVDWEVTTGTHVRIGLNTASINPSQIGPSFVPHCSGRPVAHFGQNIVLSLAQRFNPSFSGSASIDLTENNGVLQICW